MAQLYDANGNPVFSDVVQQSQVLGALAATNSIQLRGQACASIQVTGIGSLTLTFEGSTDGSNFDPVLATPIAGGAPVSSTTGNGHWVNISTAGLFIFRVRVSAYVSGNATVSVIASQGSAPPNFSSTGQQSINLASVGGTSVVTAQAGSQKVGISGAAGVTLDAAQAATAPANNLAVGGVFNNNTGTTGALSAGQASAVQLDNHGAMLIDIISLNGTPIVTAAAGLFAAAGNSTPGATTSNLCLTVGGYDGAHVQALSTDTSGRLKVDILGNAAATLDQANGSAVPTNGLMVGGGSVAGGTNFTTLTVKAASVAAAATDTSLVVQPLVGNNVQRTNQTTTAAGVVDVNIVGSLGVTNSATNGTFVRLTDNTTAITAAISALGTAPTGTSVEAVNNVALPNAAAGAACTLFQNSAVTTAVVVKASAGNIYGFMVNGGTSGNFLQFINAASAPTLGTAAVFSVQIPASGIVFAPPAALAMVNNATGISVGISTTYNGASAGTAAAVIVFYK